MGTAETTLAAASLPDTEQVEELRDLVKNGALRSHNKALDELLEKLRESEIRCGAFRQVSEYKASGGQDSFSQYDELKE